MWRVAVLVASLTGLAAGCIDTAAEYRIHFEEVLLGTAVPESCVSPNLMVSVQSYHLDSDLPDTINSAADFWDWAAGPDSMLEYLRIAAAAGGDRQAVTNAILDYVGITHNVAPGYRYIFIVFQRDRMSEFFPVFSPTWDHLFAYLSDFQICQFVGGGEEEEECQPESIVFSPTVEAELASQDYNSVTGCGHGGAAPIGHSIGSSGELCSCFPDFCTMWDHLAAARNTTGLRGCVEAFSLVSEAASVAGARAYFEVCMGCNRLFTGNGFTSDGATLNGEEFIVRGDVGLTELGFDWYELFPGGEKQNHG